MTQPFPALLAARVRKYRIQRGWSVRRLASECAKHGAVQLTTASLSNIERGQDPDAKRKARDITVEELLVLAYVLGVPPALLMIPLGEVDEMQVTPSVTAHPAAVFRWLSGSPQRDLVNLFMVPESPVIPGVDMTAYAKSKRPVDLYRALHELLGVVHQERLGIMGTMERLKAAVEQHAAAQAACDRRHDPSAVIGVSAARADVEHLQALAEAQRRWYPAGVRRLAELIQIVHSEGLRLPPIPRPIVDDLPDFDFPLEVTDAEPTNSSPVTIRKLGEIGDVAESPLHPGQSITVRAFGMVEQVNDAGR